MGPACASDCLAERSIRPTRRIGPPACWPCTGSGSTASGGSSPRAIRSRTRAGLAPLARARRRRPGTRPPSAHRRDRLRGRPWHPLHLRDGLLSGAPMPRRALRLDHGRRQSAQLPSLAALARHRAAGADRHRRSARAKPLRDGKRRRPGVGARPHSRIGGKKPARNEGPRPGFTCTASNRRCLRRHCGRHAAYAATSLQSS